MTESRIDAWITKEVDLAHRHEELLLRREALLQGTEAYYDAQERRSASFIASFPMAEERNRELLRDLDECIGDLKRDTTDPGTPKFNTLKHNYWMMLRNVYPVWQEELREYERRHQLPLTTSSPPPPPGHPAGLSPRPPPGSPPQGRTPRSPKTTTSRPTSPATSPTGTLTQPVRTTSPNGRPPSPGRKSTAKAKSASKGKKNSKGSKSSKSKSSRE